VQGVRPGAVRYWRTGRRGVPLNLVEWLRMYAEAVATARSTVRLIRVLRSPAVSQHF
jgi:hypothetical protein